MSLLSVIEYRSSSIGHRVSVAVDRRLPWIAGCPGATVTVNQRSLLVIGRGGSAIAVGHWSPWTWETAAMIDRFRCVEAAGADHSIPTPTQSHSDQV
ncbi:MAG: hypothetical protein ACR2NZ_06115 [Rubripirellula sp.]